MLNPFNYGTPVSPTKMVGRSDQIIAITNDLINPGGLSHVVIGGRRFGKSSFLESLQENLVSQIEKTGKENWYVLPFLINFKRLPERSTEGVFTFILNIIYKYFSYSRIQKKLGIQFDFNLESTLLFTFIRNKRSNCTQEEFSEIIDNLLEIFAGSYGVLRFVLLMDEIEEILDEDWTEALFSQLRSLIYEWLLRDSMRYVMAGSSRVVDVREKGSPLFNMLNITFLKALQDKDILDIINWAPNIPPNIAHIVLRISGGHPFIAQYIMYNLYELGLANATADLVAKLANKFIHERIADLEQWRQDIGETGQLVNKVLEEAHSWITEAQMREFLNNPQLSIERGLIRLCYHGVAIHKNWSEYHSTGGLVSNWFKGNVIPSTISTEPATKLSDSLPKNSINSGNEYKYHQASSKQGDNITVILQLSSSTDHTFEVSVSESPNGETPPIKSSLPYTPDELIAILKALHPLNYKAQHFTPEQIEALQRLKLWHQGNLVPDLLNRVGISLYDALMVGDIRDQLVAALQEGRKHNLPVTLQLRFYEKDVRLAKYPWELLHDKRRPLLPSGAVELIRYISYPESVVALPVTLPLRLLYIRSRPIKLGSLSSSKEQEVIHLALHELEGKGLLKIDMLDKPTFENLVEFLENHNIHVIHFDGHGVFARQCPKCMGMNYPHNNFCQNRQRDIQCNAAIDHIDPQGYLALEYANRHVHWINSEKLGVLLYGRKIQLVVLSACRSSDIGGETLFSGNAPTLIQAGIPAVVAVQLPISIEAAASFINGFYSKLATLEPIPRAVRSGRLRVYDTGEWFIPTLYLRNRDNKGNLFSLVEKESF